MRGRFSPDDYPDRDARIDEQILADAYSTSERALAWHYYLDQEILAPFPAVSTTSVPEAGLRKGQKVHVIRLLPEEQCHSGILATVRVRHGFHVLPLEFFLCTAEDEETCQAVADWTYWKQQGNVL